MSRVRRFAYSQVRLQAHHATFPGDAQWRRLEAITDLSHLLDTLRKGPMRPWVASLAAGDGPHRIEQTLRRLYRLHVLRAAAWQPEPWRPAVRWVAALAELTALDHLLNRSEIPNWVRSDPRLQPFALESKVLRLQALQGSEYRAVTGAWESGAPLVHGWNRRWHSLWPAPSPAEVRTLEQLAERIAKTHRALADSGGRESGPARQHLLSRLNTDFRRHPHEPAAVFIHLAIVALHLQRLRGLLVRLSLFGHGEAA